MPTVHETWESFWGPLLLLRFHEDNPERWSAREARAEEFWGLLGLATGDHVVDLGCGDGVLDICLARLGARVTGVDRLDSVLRTARAEAGAAPVEFRTGDLRETAFPERSLAAVLMLEVSGLMSTADERDLLRRARTWLRPGGRLLVDAPLEPEAPEFAWTREFPDGRLEGSGSYDPQTRTQTMDLRFVRKDGTIVDLVDPYDPGAGRHAGLRRRLAAPEDLVAVLEGVGFAVRRRTHPSRERAFLLVGTV